MLLYLYGEWELTGFFSIVVIANFQITSSPELLWSFICFGHRDKSCSDHFVLNVASVSIEFAPDCSCIVQCTHFIHDSITLASSEYDIFSDGALTISLSQPSSVRAVSAFRMLRHPMKLVLLATLVHMDIKAFPSRSSVPLLITNSILTSLAELFSTSFRSGHRAQSCSLQFILDVASQTSVIVYVKRAHFIHDSITLTSSEFDVSSDGPLT
ncbi:conserved hypothetical protein [Trichinella spiralis]|uniref:hypothetical protein n=1 Tax=Trichinella spiralis TaxID=6334 RepID=UPI0001EFC1FA|nr:conserved hypothetical protein [Trichinella spiralis]